MAKPLALPEFKVPEFKFPKIDLDALFGVQKANLAAAQEAQSVLVDAAQAIAKVQFGYFEQAVEEAKSAFASKELPKPEAGIASVKAAAEKSVAVAKARASASNSSASERKAEVNKSPIFIPSKDRVLARSGNHYPRAAPAQGGDARRKHLSARPQSLIPSETWGSNVSLSGMV